MFPFVGINGNSKLVLKHVTTIHFYLGNIGAVFNV